MKPEVRHDSVTKTSERAHRFRTLIGRYRLSLASLQRQATTACQACVRKRDHRLIPVAMGEQHPIHLATPRIGAKFGKLTPVQSALSL